MMAGTSGAGGPVRTCAAAEIAPRVVDAVVLDMVWCFPFWPSLKFGGSHLYAANKRNYWRSEKILTFPLAPHGKQAEKEMAEKEMAFRG